MSNYDVILGQRPDSSIAQNHDLDLGHASRPDCFLAQDDDHHHVGIHDNQKQSGCLNREEFESKYSLSGEEYVHESKYKHRVEDALASEEHTSDCNPDNSGVDSNDHQLALIDQTPDVGYSDNHDLAVLENHGINENLQLVTDQTYEMAITPAPDQDTQFVVASPILQSRRLSPTPTHELTLGQEFPDAKSCRRALREIAIALHFEIQTVKSDRMRFTAKCAHEGCPWRVHAAKLPGVPSFTIRTLHAEHTCDGIVHLGHQQASVQWVANSVEQHLRENPHCNPKEILEEIHRVHGIALSYKQAWRGKERIMASLRGSSEDDYRLLPQYCDQIKRTNPGSIASVYVNPVDNCFQHLFVSFQASIFGFLNSCRPLIGIDRTVLRSKYLGTLLVATGFDGDGALFPLAFGIVEEENDENWMWFLSELHNLLELNTENMPRLTILSDRQKSIVDAVETYFPTAFHGFCMSYLSQSFRKEFNNDMLLNLLWEAANALTITEFEAKIREIKEVSHDAAYWVMQVPAHLWANAFFEGQRYGHMTANIVESLNTWIHEASGLPIVQMMEYIRRQLMILFNERRENSMQWASILVPSAERHVSEAIERARTYQVLRADEAEFEVISHEGTHIVDIRSRCCLCRGWQLCGLPCAHAVAALLSCRQNVHRFTESCFTVATYRKAYSQTIHPIPDRTLWNNLSEGSHGEGNILDIVVIPPRSLRPAGQRRKRRPRAEEQRSHGKRVVRCSRCNETGHFRTTCAAPL